MNSTIVPFDGSGPGENESPFDQVKHLDEHGNEYWTGRDLYRQFGYARWDDTRDGIERAITAITNAEGELAAHANIEATRTKVRVGFGDREVPDYRLTRFGAYMWAMNCDPRKPEIAAAQTYFAVKTREAEAQAELTEIEVARRYLAAVEAKAALQAQVAVLEPKAAIADQFLTSEDTVYLTDLAKNLKITRHRLISVLRDEGVLYLNELQYRAGYEDWFEVVMDWVENLGQYKPALKVTRTGVRAIYELLVDGEYINPDRRTPPTRPGDNRP